MKKDEDIRLTNEECSKYIDNLIKKAVEWVVNRPEKYQDLGILTDKDLKTVIGPGQEGREKRWD